MRISKPFEKQGGFTQIDNDVLDYIMPSLKPSEWMVLSFIIRKTKGWHKEHDAISYSQFIKGTGIASNSTIKKCLDSLMEKGLVILGTTGHKADAHHYMLNKDYSFRITENVERPITFSVEQPVTKTVDTKESIKENIKQTTNGGGGIVFDADFSEVITSYENNIAMISPMVQKQIAASLEEFPKQYLIDAIEIAATANHRSWRYINGILRKWRENGRQDMVMTAPATPTYNENGSLRI